jgi:type VI secretion system FHA domain protein
MLLTLRILTYRNQPVPTSAPGRFSAAGGTVGRSPDNALVLDDPGKYISRVHAKVLFRGGEFFLEDVGSNPSIVNDRPLGKGSEIMLSHGDRVVIGDYQLQAVLEAAPAAAPQLPPAPLNNPDLPLFEPPPPPAPVRLPPLEPVVAAEPAVCAAGLPDALAGASILDVGPGEPFGTPGRDPLGLNLFGAGPAKTVPLHAADSDHVSPELAAFPRTASGNAAFAIPSDYDLLADFSPPAAEAPVVMPAREPERAVAPPVAAKPEAVPASASDSEILQALLRGLGLPDLKLNRPGPEVAESVGAMLREATAGTIDVLMARALTKKESRMDVTMLAVRSNNPLKFFPNADGALTQMLTNSMAGYMPPLKAMASAFDDLRAHELAVIAGMRAALAAVLHRFDPVQIESRLAVPTVLDKMLSANRKAKMWDRLVELYGEIAREADDDLQRLFGEKFSAAYEEQVARLRQARKQDSQSQ